MLKLLYFFFVFNCTATWSQYIEKKQVNVEMTQIPAEHGPAAIWQQHDSLTLQLHQLDDRAPSTELLLEMIESEQVLYSFDRRRTRLEAINQFSKMGYQLYPKMQEFYVAYLKNLERFQPKNSDSLQHECLTSLLLQCAKDSLNHTLQGYIQQLEQKEEKQYEPGIGMVQTGPLDGINLDQACCTTDTLVEIRKVNSDTLELYLSVFSLKCRCSDSGFRKELKIKIPAAQWTKTFTLTPSNTTWKSWNVWRVHEIETFTVGELFQHASGYYIRILTPIDQQHVQIHDLYFPLSTAH